MYECKPSLSVGLKKKIDISSINNFRFSLSYDRLFVTGRRLVVTSPGSHAVTSAHVHFYFRQSALHFPVLLMQLHAHGGVLSFQGNESLAESRDLLQEDLLGRVLRDGSEAGRPHQVRDRLVTVGREGGEQEGRAGRRTAVGHGHGGRGKLGVLVRHVEWRQNRCCLRCRGCL